MAATIKTVLGIETELLPGAKGIFDVVVDGDLIFSKYQTGRYPEHEEIVSLLRERTAAAV